MCECVIFKIVSVFWEILQVKLSLSTSSLNLCVSVCVCVFMCVVCVCVWIQRERVGRRINGSECPIEKQFCKISFNHDFHLSLLQERERERVPNKKIKVEEEMEK